MKANDNIEKGMQDVVPPTCDADGNFEIFQAGWPKNRCVDPITGEDTNVVDNPQTKDQCNVASE